MSDTKTTVTPEATETFEPFAAEGNEQLKVFIEDPARPQPQASATPAQAAAAEPVMNTITAEAEEPPVVLKGIHLDPLNNLGAGAVVERSDQAVAATDAEVEAEQDAQYGGVVGLLQKHGKVIGAAAVLAIIGFIALPKGAPTPVAPVAAPVAVQAPAAPAPAPTAAPTGDAPVGVTGGVEAYVGNGSPDDQARLAAELQRDALAIPAADQVCSNPAITAFDSMRCGQVGPQLYFKCAPDGRRWDVRKPGCENG
jgi:hypothetical protein